MGGAVTKADWTYTDLLTNGAFRTALAGLRLLPYRQRLGAMDALVRRVIAPRAGYAQRARDHLQLVFPEWDAARRDAVADASLGNLGRTLIELYSGPALSRRMARTQIQGAGWPIIEAALRDKQPVLFVTGHFGNHDATRHALVARGFQIGGLYRPMTNPFFNRHYARTMTDLSGPVFAQGGAGTMGFVRHLRGGGMATLLFDVWSAEGVPLPFLGHPAATSLAAAEIAKRTGALMVPYFATRQSDGVGFDLTIEAPIQDAAPDEMMVEATQRLEARILAHPDQYFWVHRRWKPLP